MNRPLAIIAAMTLHAVATISGPAEVAAQQDTLRDGAQEIVYSRYGAFDHEGRIGTTHVTEFRRADASRTVLVRERLENYGPVLDRFLVITFDAEGHFQSGHWVATSEFSPRFIYRYTFDGRVVRGEWEDSNRGRGYVEVPASPGDPVFTFWGVAEALILGSYQADGPTVQHLDAIAVEDNLHIRMKVAVEHAGRDSITVPAGRFAATRYRVERFGDTHHWLDDRGTLLRWVAEDGTTRWELEEYPSHTRTRASRTPVASGRYSVTYATGGEAGTLDWSLQRNERGHLVLTSEEHFGGRSMHFEGMLDTDLRWVGSSHTVDWHTPPAGVPEVQHFETFFYRGAFHLLRLRDRAYPYLQSRDVAEGLPFHLIHVPVAAVAWLRTIPRSEGGTHNFPELAVLGNFYWGASAEIQPADASYLGTETMHGPAGRAPAHRFLLAYRGGWHDSQIRYWTDDRLIPLRVDVSGFLRYDLVEYELSDPSALPIVR